MRREAIRRKTACLYSELIALMGGTVITAWAGKTPKRKWLKMKLGFAAAVAFCVLGVSAASACPYAGKTYSFGPPKTSTDGKNTKQFDELVKFDKDCSYVDYWSVKGVAERHELKKNVRGWVVRAGALTLAFAPNGAEMIVRNRDHNGEGTVELFLVKE